MTIHFSDHITALRRNAFPFLLGAPLLMAFLWTGAYVGVLLDTHDLAYAQPPWFHDPATFFIAALMGCLVEFGAVVGCVALVAGFIAGSVWLGRWLMHPCRVDEREEE